MKSLRLGMFLLLACYLFGCGTNFYGFLVFTKEENELMVLEEARGALDDLDYDRAVRLLEDLEDDSNERRFLLAAAYLGRDDVDLWSIIKNTILSDDVAEGQGIDNVFDSITSTLFGDGESRTARMSGMRFALTTLSTAPNPSESRLANLGCFLAGLWSVPTTEDAATAITGLQTEFTSINQTLVSTGDCGSTDGLEEQVTNVNTVSGDLQLISQMIEGCDLFSTSSSSGSLNSVERSLQKFTENADVGCDSSACTGDSLFCSTLEESCVQTTLNDGSASAGDGEISSCEIMYGCADSNTCF